MRIEIRKLEPVLFTLLITGFVFNLKYKGLPNTFYISSAVLLGMALYYYFKGYGYPKRLITPFYFLVPFVVSVFLTALLTANVDLFLVSLIVSIIFLITVAPYSLLSYFKDREIEIIKYIVYAGIINALFIIVMFLFAGFREFYISLLSSVDLLHVKGEDALDGLYAMRLIGLTGSATYGMAVIQVVMAFLFVYYIKSTRNYFLLRHYLGLLLIMISAVLAGRTAFVGFIFLFIYMYMVLCKKDLIKFFVTCLVLFIIFMLLAKSILPAQFYDFFEQWVLQIFVDNKSIGSVDENKAMLLAYSASDFSLFGDFKWHANELRNSYYMGTDIGWYRFVFAFGLIGTFLFIVYLLSFIKLRLVLNKKNTILFFIISFLLVVMFKAAVLFDFYMVFFVLIILSFFDQRKELTSENNLRR